MQHLTNKVDHIGKSHERILSLRDQGIEAEDKKRLKVYFVTNNETKAKKLASELDKIGYECKWNNPEERNGEYLIAGLSDELPMDEEAISEWTNLMCDLAAVQDCEFEHWDL